MATSSLLILQNVDRRERRGLMAALDASQCLMWFDAEGRVVDANVNTQDILGYDLQTMTSLDHAAIIGETDRESQHYVRHWERIRDGFHKNDERSVVNRSGTEIWSSISYAPIRTDSGETRRVLAIIIDLSPWSWRPAENGGPGRR